MAGLKLSELPEGVAQVAREAARYIGVDVEELFIADHEHEELREGAFSIAYEGQYDWPFYFTEGIAEGKYTVPEELFLEPGTGWFLAVYPPEKEDDRAREIKGTITLMDGSTSEFWFFSDADWMQYSAVQERLWRTVPILDAMARGLKDEGLMVGYGED